MKSDKPLITPFSRPSSKDWTEDFQYENGNYMNKCSRCDSYFCGHKHRRICKECHKIIEQEIQNNLIEGTIVEHSYFTVKTKDGKEIPINKNTVIDYGLGDGGKVSGYIKTSEEQEINADGTYSRTVNITEEFIIK